MVKRLTKPFAAALVALCLLFAAAVAGFIASVTVKAFADETTEPTEQTTQFHDPDNCPNKDDTLVITVLGSDGAGYTVSPQDGQTEFEALSKVLNDVNNLCDGDTISINKCINLSSKLSIEPFVVNEFDSKREITIDFCGHTATCTNNAAVIELVRRTTNDGVKDEVHFCNGRIINNNINSSTALLAVKHYRTAYLDNMEIESGTYCVSSTTNYAGYVYILAGTYRTTRSNSPAYTTSINKTIFKYIEKGNVVRFERTYESDYMSPYTSSEFSAFELPEGYMIDIDAGGTSLWVKPEDDKYFLGNDNIKYSTIAEAIEAGNTEVKLNRRVPATVINENSEDVALEYVIPAGANVTLDLNKCTFSAKIINSGNLTLKGPNGTSGSEISLFNGTFENRGEGKATAINRFTLGDDAKEYILNNTIALREDMYILVTSNGYEIQESKIEFDGKKYSSITAAIKAGVRDIIISPQSGWTRKELKEVWVGPNWDDYDEILTACYWNENITVDIGNDELTITLAGAQLRGMGSADGTNVALNIVSGRVTIKGVDNDYDLKNSLRAPADNSSYNPENIARAYTIQNAGELTIENVDIGGGVYTNNSSSVVQGALIRNTGKLIIKDSTIENTLVDSREGIERGSGIDTTGGSVELDNVYLFISGGYGVYANGGATVKLYNGTRNSSPANGTDIKLGALYLEDGASAELGKCNVYVDSKFDLSTYVADGLCFKKTAGSDPTDGNITIDRYEIGEHDYGQPEWHWAADNLSCTVEFVCNHGGETLTLPATVTSSIPDGKTCDEGIEITYTAQADLNGETYSDIKTIDVTSHTYVLGIYQPPYKTTYTALEKFDTTGMFLQLYCPVCGTNAGFVTDYEIKYSHGDSIHYNNGNDIVKFEYKDSEGNEYAYEYQVTVNQLESELKWQYSRDNTSWTDIDENTVFNYDGKDWYIRAEYLSADESKGYINVEKLLDAGTYERLINAEDYSDYAFNADSLQITLTVEPLRVNLSSKDAFGFELVFVNGNATELWDGPVYVYKAVDGKYYPSRSLLDTEYGKYQGYTFIETVAADYSVVRYRGSTALTLNGKIGENAKGQFTFVIDETSEYTANEIGIYTVKAILTATDNYAFESRFSSEIAARGLSFEISPDNKTAVVSKTWYVVQVDNYLIDADSVDEVDYDIPDWTYGAGITISAPKLAVGIDDNKTIKYVLSSGSTTIAEFHSDKFEYYINSSMFAGSYRLEVEIPVMPVDGIVYNGATFVYEFEVKAVDIGLNRDPNSETGFGYYEWEYNAAYRETFFSQFVYDISREEILTFNHAEHKGYWKDLVENDQDYTGYTITYNLSRMSNEKYYVADDNDILTLIEPGTNGTYTVYFNIEDRNHNPLTAMSDGRYAYFFIVTVYQKVEIPTINDEALVYTGSQVIPIIAESAIYKTLFSTDENAYIIGGTHSVTFELNDAVHYRWANDEEGKTVNVEFTIHKATNSWTRVPNIVNWQFETFNTNVNRIYAVAKFLDEGKHVKFTVTDAKGAAIAGLENFTIAADGTTDDEAIIKALNGLKFGTYNLKVVVDGTDNYLGLDSSIEFTITKATNRWADGENDLVLPSWIVGKYNETDNAIIINAAHGQVNIRVEDIDGNVYYNSVEGLNKLNDLAVGKYLVKAWVDETDDFTALAERAFTIEVLEKVGLPWWATLLITVGALGVAALILFILWKKGVFQILTGKIVLAIRTRASVDATIASVRAAKMMEEGRKSVAEAKRRERLEELRKKAQEARSMAPEERAAALAAKAQAEAEKAEKIRARSESMLKRADRLRGSENSEQAEDSEQPEVENEETAQPEVEQETVANEQPEAAEANAEQPENEAAEQAEATEQEAAPETTEQAPEQEVPEQSEAAEQTPEQAEQEHEAKGDNETTAEE